ATRGLGVGVHVLLTAGRWAEIRPALRDSIGGRLELRLNDPAESEINRRETRRLGRIPAGRGLMPPGIPIHVPLPRLDGGEAVDDLAEAQRALVAEIAAAWTGPAAPPVRVLPQRITVTELDAVAAAGESALDPWERDGR